MLNHEEILELLRQDVVPALGCTEPVCVALAAADASKAAGGDILHIKVTVSPNICKNGMSVGIPGFDRVGLKYAAALGAFLKNPEKKLELMEDLTPEISAKAIQFVEEGGVELSIAEGTSGIYVKCELTGAGAAGFTVIKGGHANIVLTQVGSAVLFQKEESARSEGNLYQGLKTMRVAEIREAADSFSEEQLAFLMDGVDLNEALSQYGLEHRVGVGAAAALKKAVGTPLIGAGLMERIMLKVASSTEVRLQGCPYAAMSSAGSGSKGIAVILPVYETSLQMGAGKEKTVKALAFAHLLNTYINLHIGKLSALCSCGVASSTAAAAAVTWLMGGTDEQIGWAIRNMTGSITGMICDGGKVGCSLKLAAASAAGFLSAVLAMDDAALRATDGICALSPEECIENMGRISDPGMTATDHEILKIMLEKSHGLD